MLLHRRDEKTYELGVIIYNPHSVDGIARSLTNAEVRTLRRRGLSYLRLLARELEEAYWKLPGRFRFDAPIWERVGVSLEEWHELKDAVLSAAHGTHVRLGEKLWRHKIGRKIREYLDTGCQKVLDQAAAELAGTGDRPWLCLFKS
jgi:hypothetical protein